MKKSRLTRYYQISLLVLLLLALVAWTWIPGVSDFLHGSLAAFTTLDQHALETVSYTHLRGPRDCS